MVSRFSLGDQAAVSELQLEALVCRRQASCLLDLRPEASLTRDTSHHVLLEVVRDCAVPREYFHRS